MQTVKIVTAIALGSIGHPAPQRTSTRRSAPLNASERVIDRGRTAT